MPSNQFAEFSKQYLFLRMHPFGPGTSFLSPLPLRDQPRERRLGPTFLRPGLVVLAFSTIAGALFGQAQPPSQNEPFGEFTPDYVVLSEVTPIRKDDDLYLRVRGESPLCPAGTQIDFVLTWRASRVESYPFTATEDRQIAAEFKVGKVPRTREHFHLRTIIYEKEQSRRIKKEIEALDSFHPALEPWTNHHFKQSFQLWSLDEVETEESEVAEYFDDKIAQLRELDKAVQDQKAKVVGGEEWVTLGGSFEVKRWRKWFDEEIVSELRKLSILIEDQFYRPKFLPYRHGLFALKQAHLYVSARIFLASIETYREYGHTPHQEDLKPPGFPKLPQVPGGELNLGGFQKRIDISIGRIPNDRVERAFILISNPDFDAVIFRHLTQEELDRGQFDALREQATWSPTEEDVIQFEAGLKEFLSKIYPDDPRLIYQIYLFRRQFVGLTRGDQQILHCTFVNSVSPTFSESMLRVIEVDRDPARVFSMEYNPESQEYRLVTNLKKSALAPAATQPDSRPSSQPKG